MADNDGDLHVYLFIYLFIYFFNSLIIHILFICLFVYLFICLFIYLFVYLFIYLFVYLFIRIFHREVSCNLLAVPKSQPYKTFFRVFDMATVLFAWLFVECIGESLTFDAHA